jgi:hypothetical protein
VALVRVMQPGASSRPSRCVAIGARREHVMDKAGGSER